MITQRLYTKMGIKVFLTAFLMVAALTLYCEAQNTFRNAFRSFDRLRCSRGRCGLSERPRATDVLADLTRSRNRDTRPQNPLRNRLRNQSRNRSQNQFRNQGNGQDRQNRQNPEPTGRGLPNVIRLVREFINADEQRIPNMVQLVFHTCVGSTGCDGCLNPNEHSNKGLIGTYGEVQNFWRPHQSVLSLADMIVLLGSIAVEEGMGKSGGAGRRSVAFRTGRTTCANPRRYTLNHRFPKGEDTNSVEFLMSEFGLPSRASAIALLGAHSLGQCRTENSGFNGPWDGTPTTLDNHYFLSMAGTNWRVTPASDGHTQWSSPDGRMMLHADLHIDKDINGGQPSCRASTQCPRSRDAEQVADYARNQNEWADDFVDAFVRMCNH